MTKQPARATQFFSRRYGLAAADVFAMITQASQGHRRSEKQGAMLRFSYILSSVRRLINQTPLSCKTLACITNWLHVL